MAVQRDLRLHPAHRAGLRMGDQTGASSLPLAGGLRLRGPESPAFCVAFTAGVTIFTAAAFFIWFSVFNLFVVSFFWSKVSDAFSREEAHRLYG